ncbi:unnamed protein product [Vitrella brassicaformis CCMP3155]|uniref:EamA domain-containing protein n=2 Tax=Vitrella brassicaformis TaxID=1169539 RepID=A0A0G4GPS4_VITBC|nr:unnamed protein product [Vitrella brassicaformis CCMP3155]|eukprot:CEM32349.1 unnamed protein product [Vitrella brassicaformis CCMP3155]
MADSLSSQRILTLKEKDNTTSLCTPDTVGAMPLQQSDKTTAQDSSTSPAHGEAVSASTRGLASSMRTLSAPLGPVAPQSLSTTLLENVVDTGRLEKRHQAQAQAQAHHTVDVGGPLLDHGGGASGRHMSMPPVVAKPPAGRDRPAMGRLSSVDQLILGEYNDYLIREVTNEQDTSLLASTASGGDMSDFSSYHQYQWDDLGDAYHSLDGGDVTDVRRYSSLDALGVSDSRRAVAQIQGYRATPADPLTLLSPGEIRRAAVVGLTMCVLSTACFATMSLFVKLNALAHIGSAETMFLRCCFQFLVTLVWIKLGTLPHQPLDKPILPPPTRRMPHLRYWVILRGVVDCIGVSCYYVALTKLSLAYATILYFTAPFFAGITSRLLIKEPYGLAEALYGIGAIFGVALSSIGESGAAGSPGTPTDRADQIVGIVCALFGAFCQGLTFCFIRKIGLRAHYLQLVNAFASAGIALMPIFLLIQGHWPWEDTRARWTWVVMVYTLCIGTFATIGQLFLNLGAQRIKASVASLLRTLDILFTLILQMLVLNEPPPVLSCVGCFVIILCCTLSAGSRHH